MAVYTPYHCDEETGEIIMCQVNEETGEPSMNQKFSGKTSVHEHKRPRKQIRFPRGYMSKTKKFQTLKDKILTGSNTISHIMLLSIPTFMIFPNLVCVMFVVLEIFLHIYCHKKNGLLKNSQMFYQSPFHIVTSIFCGVCRDRNTASKITAIHNKRRYRYN